MNKQLKKKWLLIAAIVIVSALIVVASIPPINAVRPYYEQYRWNKFFDELVMDNVQETRILLEDGSEAVMTRDETIELVDQLKQIRLGATGNYRYCYSNVKIMNFRVIMSDGFQFDFGVSDSQYFYILNQDRGHDGDYHVCEDVGTLWAELNAKYCGK